MRIFAKVGSMIWCVPRAALWSGLLVAVLVSTAPSARAEQADMIFYGGDVLTMDPAGTVAEAVWVRGGMIEAVGKRAEVMRNATQATRLVDLHGGALLPGFVEPHLHLDIVAQMAFYTDLNPCLPEPYERRTKCPKTILGALEILKNDPQPPTSTTWLVGSGIDPSLMSLDDVQPASVFRENPAKIIAETVSATRPVFILDKSFHLAYVNLQAFVAAGICESISKCSQSTALKSPPQSPAKWVIGQDGVFTGVIEEPASYTDFAEALPKAEKELLLELATAGAREIARAGVTTMVNPGTVAVTFPDLLPTLARKWQDHPWLRYRALVAGNAPKIPAKPTPWEKGDALWGITGIKIWADGSTQGCTAALTDPYAKNGSCSDAGLGMIDFELKQLIANLQPFWQAGWPIQIHVNGDRAIESVLTALATLQVATRNDSPITLIHFTVDGNPAKGEDKIQKVAELRAGRYLLDGKPVPAVDVRVSHLIAHVAYWGGALQGILDGVSNPKQPDDNGRAALLDATRRDLELGVPFSLHSDAPVGPAHPLWYVEQAVTRRTWFYPHLKSRDAHPMPGGQNVSIEQALRAVTIEPARQHGLDRHIGSIEKGKVADLVILDKNPLMQPPDKIHAIRVLSTFVSGYRNDWQ